jgi:hypothetical protein
MLSPFGGPQAVLAYLSRYTHRVAIANSRLIAFDRTGVSFRWKDYRADGRDRQKIMTLATPQIPDPCPATRLPPHPPLRPVSQRHARRQHRSSARAARRFKT